MPYQHCRWYDPYPGLAFILKLLRLMPREQQTVVGERLNQYLLYRMIHLSGPANPTGNRWYDEVPGLLEGLERLKVAPDPIKQQSTDFLVKLLEEAEASPQAFCA